MSIDTALTTVSLATAAGATFQLVAQLVAWQRQEKIANILLRERELPTLESDDDPNAINAYLFNEAGKLSIHEYAKNSEVREVVKRAVARIDEGLEMQPTSAGGAAAASTHLAAARRALAAEDYVAALARTRLAIELDMQRLAEFNDLPLKGASPARAIDPLARAEVISPMEAHSLKQAVRVANAALHGEDIVPRDAREAVDRAIETLSAIGNRHSVRRP